MPASSNSARVECRFLSGAVALERALLPDGVRALENPVLPGGEAREDFRFHRFGAAEAQIGFEPGERIGRKARPLLQKHADLILPADVIEREGDETQAFRRLGTDPPSHGPLGLLSRAAIGKTAAPYPPQPSPP